MRTRPVEVELFHAGGRTDRHNEANIRFTQLCERVKKKDIYILQLQKCIISNGDTQC